MKWFIMIFVLVLACTLAPAAKASPQKTLLWEVTSPYRTLYVTGETQLLTGKDYPLPAAVMHAFDTSGELVLEGNPGTSATRTHQLIVKYGLLTPPLQLGTQLSVAQLQTLKQALSTLGVPYAKVSSLRPWLVALFLQQTAAAKLGLSPTEQEEPHFYKLAKSRGIRITPLRGTAEELHLFATLPEPLPVEWLMMGAEQVAAKGWRQKAAHQSAQVVAAWHAGDTGVFARLLKHQFQGHTQLYQALVTNRNEDWLKSLRAKLSTRGAPVFVIVGAGHLVGDGNLISALSAAGYHVTQL